MKIVVLSNAHHLAHVSRPLEVAKVLRGRGHEVLFAGHGKYLETASWDGFPTRHVPFVPAERAARLGRSEKIWKWFRDLDLESFVEAELALYSEFRPDLVLIDNRVTARASAEKAGLPAVAILNVHMSNYRRIPYVSVADLPLGERLPGAAQLDRLENASECLFWDRMVMGDLNRLRRRLGLKRVYAFEHEEGDVSLLADIPEFNPVWQLPPHMSYVGPLTWHNDLPAPGCLGRLDPDRPTLYLSLGSVGLQDLLIAQLGRLPGDLQIVVAAGGETGNGRQLADNVFVEGYVNTDRLLPHCDLVCCHGGNGTLYQALSFGLPIVVVSTHAEQSYGGKRIQKLGLGKAVTQKVVENHGLGTIVSAVRVVLGDPRYGTNARKFARYLQQWEGPRLAADAIEGGVGYVC